MLVNIEVALMIVLSRTALDISSRNQLMGQVSRIIFSTRSGVFVSTIYCRTQLQ